MNGAAVFLVAFFTAALTSVGAVYLVERLDIFAEPEPVVETVVVPSLRGQSEKDASGNLQVLVLSLFVIGSEPSAGPGPASTVAAVLRQSHAPGVKVRPGTVLHVTMSEPLVVVPTAIGQSRDAAEALVKSLGLVAAFGDEVPHQTVPKGSVASQTPGAGESVAPGGEVRLNLSSGPAAIEVPKVTGHGLSRAKKMLDEAGLKHLVRWVDLPETASNIVLRQTPKAGSQVKADESITLVINRD